MVVHSHLPRNVNSFITLLLFSVNSQGLIMEKLSPSWDVTVYSSIGPYVPKANIQYALIFFFALSAAQVIG